MAGVFGACEECAAASNPQLRLFKPTRAQSSTPLYMLSSPPTSFHNWSAASPVAACGPAQDDRSVGFSAACLYYSQELQERLQVPGKPPSFWHSWVRFALMKRASSAVGAVDTSWGGKSLAQPLNFDSA